jgi:hypothetical protein
MEPGWQFIRSYFLLFCTENFTTVHFDFDNERASCTTPYVAVEFIDSRHSGILSTLTLCNDCIN